MIFKAKEILSRPNESEFTEAEQEEMQTKSTMIELLKFAFFLQSINDTPADITEEELISILPEINLVSSYEKWNKKLLENGFKRSKTTRQELINDKKIRYEKKYDYSVQGDHALDILYIRGVLDESGLKLQYYSSIVLNRYSNYCDNEKARKQYNENLTEKIKQFTLEYSKCLKSNENDIQITNDGVFEIPVKKDIDLKKCDKILLKFALFLDKDYK